MLDLVGNPEDRFSRVAAHIACNACTEYVKRTCVRSDNHELFEDHRIGTVSNAITRGLKPV